MTSIIHSVIDNAEIVFPSDAEAVNALNDLADVIPLQKPVEK